MNFDVHINSKVRPAQGLGIGDSLLMLPVVQGLINARPQDRFRIVVKQRYVDWAKLGAFEVAAEENYRPSEREIWPNQLDFVQTDLEAAKRGCSRQDIWAASAGVKAAPVTPVISAASSEWAAEQVDKMKLAGRPLVWIAPFSAHTGRTWALRRWVELSCLLQAAGCALGGFQCRDDPANCMWFPGAMFVGAPAEWSAALLEHAALFIGNDSGMAHLAGFMRRPTIALCGLTTGKIVFGSYPTVRAIDGETDLEDQVLYPEVKRPGMNCEGCLGLKERGWQIQCFYGCDMLDSIKAGEVCCLAKEMLSL